MSDRSNADRLRDSKEYRITIRLTRRQMAMLNHLTEVEAYTSRNSAIRYAILRLFDFHGLKLVDEDKTLVELSEAGETDVP